MRERVLRLSFLLQSRTIKDRRHPLYHNNHDGTFTDVSDSSGVGKPESKGMGVVLADFNGDGWPDIAIANDTWPNFLFLNNGDGTFKDVSLISGLAASEDGGFEAGWVLTPLMWMGMVSSMFILPTLTSN